ncbi:MAG: class I SAM-dependent methyltransferase, partial [Myxococcaceae bacterium]
GKRFLNLFAYTGAFTVYAAAGGAESTTTVDLSNTYCDWATENLELNGLWDERQEIGRADVLEWLEWAVEEKLQFDLVVLDPPSFSASKKMKGSWNVQRDHVLLLRDVISMLTPGGTLYFSTNFLGFELREDQLRDVEVEELTPGSIPEDFHFKKIHRCWRITAR